ncbi:serpentine type 7TM GPCR chemoreceptor srt domain-containing protein [Ditylenchus destructor]|nr:serpentine type 7TM GPCR chemoreceptor srt domain-containing protein [Ditylenchus destructor]
MDLFLFHTEEYNKLYNCTSYDVDNVPIESRRRPILGWLFIISFFVLETLYIPCVLSISKRLRYASFKFMFYIGIGDLIALWISGFLTGYLALTGAVFCSHPTVIYMAGNIGIGCWYVESLAAMFLAFNRCVEIWSPHLARRMFRDNLIWLWLLPVTLYAFLGIFFTKPGIFNSIYFSWFFNPHIGYLDDVHGVYTNVFHSIHNGIVCVGLSILYVIFCITLALKRNHYQHQAQTSRQSRMPFIQVFLITVVNFVASSVYVSMNFIPISEALIVTGSLMWFLAHGIPPVIYLTMNATVRRDCRRYWLKFLNIRNIQIAVSVPTAAGLSTIQHSLATRPLDSSM